MLTVLSVWGVNAIVTPAAVRSKVTLHAGFNCEPVVPKHVSKVSQTEGVGEGW